MRLTLALFFVAFAAAAQTPEVPHKMEFAGMTLTIRDDARREIQKDVNALTQSPRHHLIKVERARTYFPIIERVFAEEQIPDDFKYLVLQESALIADAVSVSNAVGFWQFKDFTAVEMGLRVDKEVDERLNIVSSSRAAARYIKKNNTFFNNWIYALQAYQMGAGGVMRVVGKGDLSKKNMEITPSTYWYVKKFLAHKIAFESSVGGEGQIKVIPYVNSTNKHLNDLAKEVAVDEIELQTYNKWAKKGTIPGDRQYTVLIPMKGDGVLPEMPTQPVAMAVTQAPASTAKPATTSALKGRTKINGISAIRPESNETATALAARAGVSVSDLLKWNDISLRDALQTNTYYLLGKKRARAASNYHTVEAREDLWKISQRYGVQLKKLKRYNRLSGNDEVKAGTTVWLSSMKPKGAPSTPVASKGPVVQVEDDASFGWTVDPSTPSATVIDAPAQKTTTSASERTREENKPNVDSNAIGTESSATSVDESNAVGQTTPAPDKGEAVVATAEVVTAPVGGEAASDAVPVSAETNNQATSSPSAVEQNETSSAVAASTTPPDSVGVAKQPVVSVPKGKDTHTVKAGETLYGIAHGYGLGVMDLVTWNDLNLQEGIKPGQVLKLRSPEEREAIASASTITTEHVVKPSDTLYSVARKYNVTIKELMDWNNKKDFSLAIGEKLIVKGR